MNYNIDQSKVNLIHEHFSKELKIGTDTENVFKSVNDTKRLKKEISRLKAIIRALHPDDRSEYKSLLKQLIKR